MKKLFTLFTFCVFLIPCSVRATDYTVGESNATMSYVMPIVTSSSTYTSITQQLFLASDLTAIDASAGDIAGITFFYGGKGNNTAVASVTRTIEVYLTSAESSFTEFVINSSTHKFKYVSPGTKVFDGSVTTESLTAGQVKELPIVFSSSYSWDGIKNIVLTVIDKTNKGISDANLRFALKATTTARFIHCNWMTESDSEFAEYKSSLEDKEGLTYGTGTGWNTDAYQTTQHKYVNKLTFTINPPVPVPTSPNASSVTSSSAVLGWTAADGADSYEVRYGTTSGSLGAATNVGNVTSYSLSGLEDETTYYYQIRTKIGISYSAWTDESSFTTSADSPFDYKGITFTKWTDDDAIPTSGIYYLNNDVTLGASATLTDDLTLCLNGHSINTYAYNIIVPEGKTLTIYNNESTGRIYGKYEAPPLWLSGLISVEGGGTLIMSEGSVVNEASVLNEDCVAYAIYNKGTLKLSGSPVISALTADIGLFNNRYITIESGKPLTNETPYSVTSGGQTITSGWSNMSGAKPSAHFTSAKSGYAGICVSGGEAILVKLLELDDAIVNEGITDGTYGGLINISINRSFSSSYCNTICLPFSLTHAQLQEIFGTDYKLWDFTGSSLDGEDIALGFSVVTALTAGKPYLIKPSVDVVNPTFEGVTIAATEPADPISDAYINFKGIYAPKRLTAGDHSILFLGANNRLFFASEDGYMNGFRAYFEVKEDARLAVRAHIVQRENATTGIENPSLKANSQKRIKNGQLLIEHNGVLYNAQGQIVQ